ncbi:MAG TPA: membrane dipeptidase, partial [Terriglobales bacterium]|nr:membrane dipeptidase [Terriglobales bacterium]
MRRIVLLLGIVAALVAFLFATPALIDRALNRVVHAPREKVSDDAQRLHALLQIADMHADPLLWQRDLVERIDHGHVDIPRLIAGNVAVQIFSTPTQVPLGLNYDANELGWDMVSSLAFFQRWPAVTWRSPLQRALHMAAELEDAAQRSGGKFRVLTNRSELADYLAARRSNRTMTAGVLSIEGMQVLEGDLGNFERLRAAGFRMMGLTHFFDNAVGGSAHGVDKGGLTELGRQLIARIQASGVIVDLAHSSPQLMEEVLAISKRPVVVSHGGVKGTCDTIRNLSDDQARAV